MPVEHVNRKGNRYYLLVGKTKTGKPKYYCSKKPSGVPAEAIPEGFELHENPENAQVSVRRVRSSRILPVEREQLARGIRQHAKIDHFIIDIDGDSLVVYVADVGPDASARIIGMLLGAHDQSRGLRELPIKHGHYTPMMRFDLHDEDERTYTAARWCFRGSVDRWIDLPGTASLADQARKYGRHLGHESFFELY